MSCPAASSATSWSRRWRSVGGLPSASRCFEQEGEHRVAGRLRAAASHQVEEQVVEVLHRQPELAPRAARPEVALHERHGDHARHRAHDVERAVHGVAEPGRLVVASAEHHPQDRLERELLHPLERGHAPAPRAELPLGQLGHHRLERAHALAVEGRLDQAALAQVLLSVEHQDRVRPGEGPHELPALAGRGDGRVEPEHLPHRLRAREQHHRLVGPERADRDRIAEALVHAPQERSRPHRPPDRLPGGWGARAGRQLCDQAWKVSMPPPLARTASPGSALI